MDQCSPGNYMLFLHSIEAPIARYIERREACKRNLSATPITNSLQRRNVHGRIHGYALNLASSQRR